MTTESEAPEHKTKAQRLFDSWLDAQAIECELFDELYDRLLKKYGEHCFDEISHDYYDRSIELKGCKPGLTLDEATLKFIADMGFEKGWLNYTDSTERMFGPLGVGELRAVDCPRISTGSHLEIRRAVEAAIEAERKRAEAFAIECLDERR